MHLSEYEFSQKLAADAWVEYLRDDNSKIVDLFQVQLRSRLICGNEECQHVSLVSGRVYCTCE
jgi:ubiquitin C-terminal hydrolase